MTPDDGTLGESLDALERDIARLHPPARWVLAWRLRRLRHPPRLDRERTEVLRRHFSTAPPDSEEQR